MSVRIQNESDMTALAGRLAPWLRRGDVVALTGDLGAGKSVFARGLIRALAGAAVDVPSPTFTLVQVYDFPELAVWHFDLYRLAARAADILELGWEDARRDGVALVEWPDRLGALLPRDRLDVEIVFDEDFDDNADTARRVRFTPHGRFAARFDMEEMTGGK